MMRTGRIAVALVVGLVAVLVGGCASSGSDKAGGKTARRPVVLTLANFLGDSEEVEGFAAEVSRLSGGTIRIDARSRWRYGQVAYENGLIGDVRARKADLGVAGSRAWDSVGVTSLRALGAPFLIDSYALEDRVVRSPLISPMMTGLRPLGLVALGVLPGPLRRPLAVLRPLLAPSDYAGLRIGVQQSRVGSATLRALRATPVWFAAGAPIRGLDGVELHVSAIQGYQYDQVGKYLTANVVLWPRPLVLFANREAFAKLTPAQRRILTRAVTDDLTAELKSVRDNERTDTASLCRSHGLRFLIATPADVIALRRAVQPVYDELERDPQIRREIAQIEVMRASLAPESALSCSPGAPPAAKPAPLDGVYRFTVTVGDLTLAGAAPSELVPENYGSTTFVLDRGRFAFTQENTQACTWGKGTFSVRGDRIELLFAGGGGIAPTRSTNKPGEFFTFEWSLFRDALTLRRVAGAVSPTPLIAKAWRRVTATASIGYFSNRCSPPANSLPR